MKKGHYIREWRKFYGMTIDGLADLIGVSKAVISRIETGQQRYNQEILEAIAANFMCKPGDLIMRDPTTPDITQALGGLTAVQREALMSFLGPARGERAPTIPKDIEAERAVLGALMCSLDLKAVRICCHIMAGYFYDPGHASIWNALGEIADRAEPSLDPVSLDEMLGGDPDYERLGGLRYLNDLVVSAPNVTSIGPHIGRIVSAWYQRELHKAQRQQ